MGSDVADVIAPSTFACSEKAGQHVRSAIQRVIGDRLRLTRHVAGLLHPIGDAAFDAVEPIALRGLHPLIAVRGYANLLVHVLLQRTELCIVGFAVASLFKLALDFATALRTVGDDLRNLFLLRSFALAQRDTSQRRIDTAFGGFVGTFQRITVCVNRTPAFLFGVLFLDRQYCDLRRAICAHLGQLCFKLADLLQRVDGIFACNVARLQIRDLLLQRIGLCRGVALRQLARLTVVVGHVDDACGVLRLQQARRVLNCGLFLRQPVLDGLQLRGCFGIGQTARRTSCAATLGQR